MTLACGLEGGMQGVWGSGGRKGRARDWRVYRLGARHRRRAHLEHARHPRHAGNVEAQRLVEGRRVLPSQEEGTCAVRGEVRAAEGGAARRRKRRARDCIQVGGTRGERTENMLPMFVTSDVRKFSGWLKADAPCRVGKMAHAVRGEVRPAEGGRAWSSGGTSGAHATGEYTG